MSPNHDPAPVFPISAIQGQPALVQALLLAAIEPQLGGVLIRGPRGTAKSTAARALADLLAPAPFVTLPLGASIEHVTGSLDLSKALAGHELAFAPGLIAKAHEGVLYVDEINLLPDAIVDVLLDVAASGINRIERDGISHSHAARFVLVGTMNPEEGMLRPQLLDRLGLCVQLDNAQDPQLRSSIVKARLRFDLDPQGFVQSHAARQQEIRQRLAQARSRCRNASELAWSDAVHEAVALQCIAAQVDGLRADLVMLRAARALAAWQGSHSITPAHVSEVAPLVLQHRAAQPDPGSASQPRQAPASTPPAAPAAQSGKDSKDLTEPDIQASASPSTASREPGATSSLPPDAGPGLEQPPAGWGQAQAVSSVVFEPQQADAMAQAALEALAAKKARASGLLR
ncbi:ATP-binding protein [Comamonas testosteroni]|uniref:Magnesium-chelatase 38 kDa subunit n=1 Tax=Comamonas testosteroni TaxID=285 RepID=A0A8B4S2S3_COMTE|nr:ATP-binding protein [Comamonas testosteroni]EHN64069.1 ATPase [Comamonas testosteroni ATCC 11996]QQN69212.1 ATP-binding protein [Comamonas testosteroni]SUY77414.1 Magnesium-chelatase 38 kDa subunit [Comamonas testosteroni]